MFNPDQLIYLLHFYSTKHAINSIINNKNPKIQNLKIEKYNDPKAKIYFPSIINNYNSPKINSTI